MGTPDLGGADVCLYYSLDFFQSDGSCRENYDRVYFAGRWTCRWAELGASRAAWYTLQDEELGPEWIKARNVDCHLHRKDVNELLGISDSDSDPSLEYTGGCTERRPQGHGTVADFYVDPADEDRRADGRYVGAWSRGRMTGKGILTKRFSYDGATSRLLVYEGEFVGGLVHGQGTVTQSEGSEGAIWHRWAGEFQRGVLRRGVITNNDGARWEGEYRNRSLWNGTYTDARGNIFDCRDGRCKARKKGN